MFNKEINTTLIVLYQCNKTPHIIIKKTVGVTSDAVDFSEQCIFVMSLVLSVDWLFSSLFCIYVL